MGIGSPRPALVACSHGTSSPEGQRAIAALVEAVADRLTGIAVHPAFVDVQRPAISEVLDAIDDPVVVVPLLLTAGYHVHVDLTDAVSAHPQARLAPALGPDDRLVELLASRLDDVGAAPDDAVILASAGSSDARAVAACAATAESLAARLGRPVTSAYLSAAAPAVAESVDAARVSGRRSAVVSHLLAPGYFQGLIAQSGADVWTPPLLIDGHAPGQGMIEVVIDRYLHALEA